MSSRHPHDKGLKIDFWVQRLVRREMPAFANTARLIAGEAARGDATAAELARAILQDASMTTRLLRIANSIHFNPPGSPINTVSRAIVMLGFEAVRNLCLSIAIVDTLVEGHSKQRVLHAMACSFHAAVQARALAEQRRDRSPEEVFIAALLYQLGSMAFWCFGDEVDRGAVARLQRADEAGELDEDAERAALGFTLRELTQALNREWRLSPLLESALDDRVGEDPRVSNITLAHRIAAAAAEGWQNSVMDRLLERASESLYLPREQVTRLIHDNARKAADTMANLGAPRAGELIPVPDSGGPPVVAPFGDVVSPPFLEPDPGLQLDILGEIAQLLAEPRPQTGLLLQMALEGVYRGVGMDRALIALVTPQRDAVRAKLALGWDDPEQAQRLHFRLSEPPRSLIDQVVQDAIPLWVRHPPQPELESLLTPELARLSGGGPFFLLPIELHGRVVGLLYADRRPSRRALDRKSFEAAQLFAHQVRLGLTYLKAREP